MPALARTNGLWRGPSAPELQALTYAERRVVQLARLYVSVKRVFLNRARSFASAGRDEAPRYHERNVVAYPQNPDQVMTLIGLLPKDLNSSLAIQFVGSDRSQLRFEPTLTVSVDRLRSAFFWLSTNCWPWMEATKYSGIRGRGELGQQLEALLEAYGNSIGPSGIGVPSELIEGATQVPEAAAGISRAGPADAVAGMSPDEDEPSGDLEGHFTKGGGFESARS